MSMTFYADVTSHEKKLCLTAATAATTDTQIENEKWMLSEGHLTMYLVMALGSLWIITCITVRYLKIKNVKKNKIKLHCCPEAKAFLLF